MASQYNETPNAPKGYLSTIVDELEKKIIIRVQDKNRQAMNEKEKAGQHSNLLCCPATGSSYFLMGVQ